MYENKLATAGFRIIYDVDEDVDILLKRTADESADILILSREQAIEAGRKGVQPYKRRQAGVLFGHGLK